MTSAFQPNWASSPGETIARMLSRRAMSHSELSRRIGLTEHQVVELLSGRLSIQLGLARSLSESLGGTLAFWMARDYKFRQHELRNLPDAGAWLKMLPVRDMERLGWIGQDSHADSRLANCLQFFGVSSIHEWEQRYVTKVANVALKKSQALTPKAAALAAWLRRGEMMATREAVATWDRERFTGFLSSARELTRNRNPESFLPALRDQCAQCGVGFAFVEALPGCPVHGATFRTDADIRVLLLGPRLRTLDHFWFAFFHEAGHLLLHDAEMTFLEGIDTDARSRLEDEANRFAEDCLIPQYYRDDLMKLPVTPGAIARFARRVGVSTTIVIGQLEHYQRVSPGHLNKLKQRF